MSNRLRSTGHNRSMGPAIYAGFNRIDVTVLCTATPMPLTEKASVSIVEREGSEEVRTGIVSNERGTFAAEASAKRASATIVGIAGNGSLHAKPIVDELEWVDPAVLSVSSLANGRL